MTGRHNVPTAQTPSETRTVVAAAHQDAPDTSPAVHPATLPDSSFFKYLPRTLMATNLILLLLLAFQMFHRPKYEYMTASPGDYGFSEEMNKLGAQGWKTESCRRASDGADYSPTFSYECVMSRPKLGW